MFADYHVHSEFSDDSSYPMDEVCAHACELGIAEPCFTDHVDYGVKPDFDNIPSDMKGVRIENGIPVTNVDYKHYFPRIEQMREQFAPNLVVRTGMEFGAQSHTLEQFNALFERYASVWDFIILSIHQVDDQEFWSGDFQKGRTQAEYNMAYYEEMLYVAEHFDNWSVLGHLDLIKRYDPAGIWPDSNTRDIVAEILKCVIRKGKGIEVNTSSFRYGLPDLQPSTEILHLYRDLGGRILTFGSDSHKPEHLGAHIPEVHDRVRALGYSQFCTFDHMEPMFCEL